MLIIYYYNLDAWTIFLKELWQIWNYYVLIHISKTNNLIVKCNTPMCRYGQLLHFLYLPRKRLTCLWGHYVQFLEIWLSFYLQLDPYAFEVQYGYYLVTKGSICESFWYTVKSFCLWADDQSNYQLFHIQLDHFVFELRVWTLVFTAWQNGTTTSHFHTQLDPVVFRTDIYILVKGKWVYLRVIFKYS
jgi:hypothetical protein